MLITRQWRDAGVSVEEYEVRYFADENGISMDDARELIHKHGNDRETLTARRRSFDATNGSAGR